MEAAQMETTDLAKKLGVSYQAVRKVLQQGGQFGTENNAAAARVLGVSSDWLATGKGPRHASYAAAEPRPEYESAPAPPPPGRHFDALTDEEQQFLDNFREIAADEDAAREILELVQNRAARMRAMKERWMEQVGIPVPQARRAADQKKTEIARAALDVTEELRQRSLSLDEAPPPPPEEKH